MIQIVKQHKVTGEIVKAEARKEWIGLDGKIPARIFAMIKAATEKASEWNVIGQEGTQESARYQMTEKDKDLKDYCDSRTRIERAMNH